MALGVRMKRTVVPKFADRRRNKGRVGVKGHRGGYSMDDSDGEVFTRVEELDRLSNLRMKSRDLRSNFKQNKKRFEKGEENNSELPRWRMGRTDTSKDEEKEMKPFVRDRKQSFKNIDATRKSKVSDARLFAGRPAKTMRRDEDKEMKPFVRSREQSFRNVDVARKSKTSDSRFFAGRPANTMRRDEDKEMKPFFREREQWCKNVDVARKSKGSDARLFAGRPTKTMRKVVGKDASDYGHSSRGFYRSKERCMETEASAGNIILKRRKLDGELAEGGNTEDEDFERHALSKGGANEISEEKPVRRPARVLDKTGRLIRVQAKTAENGSTETSSSKKKTRRVIKIDPYDISNKRLDDGVPISDITAEKETAVSMNAQFRAIQPSDEILSFVEDNLLGRRRLIELQNSGYNVKLSAPLDNIPFSTIPDREKMEENVFRNKLEFFAAAKISSSFPPPTRPEIAFAGRSNVGKSSLLNSLTRQWGVVRTSDKPGLTQTINFFKLASKLCLVDLPGYGFAYAKEEIKDAWEELVKEYVSTRVGLQRVCLLVDTKWGMKIRDFELIELMERSKTPYQIVLTKTDVVFPIDVARRAMQIQENLKNNKSIVDPVLMVSSKSGAGIRNLRNLLAKIARFV